MEFIDVLISVVLAFIMFGVGTSLSVNDFEEVQNKQKTYLYGLSMQMLFLPLLAFVICSLVNIPPPLKIGIIILSLCPGGATSNFISYLLNLKTALSISLTVVNSFLILFTIPLGVNLASKYYLEQSSTVHLSFSETTLNVLLIILLPAFLGMVTKSKFPNFVQNFKNPIKFAATILLALVFIIKFFAGEDQGGTGISTQDIFVLLPVVLTLHFLSMLISYLASVVMNVEPYDSVTICIEVGLQNTTLALLISSVMLSNEEFAKPALVYAMFSFFTTLGFAYLLKRRVDQINISA